MKTPMHGKYYNLVFASALLLIVALFGAAFYFVLNFKGTFEAPDVVLLAGGGIGLLALLTGVFYVASQIDTRLAGHKPPEEEEKWVISDEY
jgi:hypothetical protein